MRALIIGILFLGGSVLLHAQDSQLAQKYYNDGEFEKASVLFERLHKTNPTNDYFFNRYIECLLALEDFDNGEKAIKKELKKNPNKLQLYVTLGNLFERQIKDDQAQEQYEKAIKKLPPDRFAVIKLAQAFTTLTKYDMAIQTYEKGFKMLKQDDLFSYNLGDLYTDEKEKVLRWSKTI